MAKIMLDKQGRASDIFYVGEPYNSDRELIVVSEKVAKWIHLQMDKDKRVSLKAGKSGQARGDWSCLLYTSPSPRDS